MNHAPAANSRRAPRPPRRAARPLRRGRARVVGSVAVIACLLALAGCIVQPSPKVKPAGPPIRGGTATFALQVGQDFSWIFPIENTANDEPWDLNVEESIWRPLYFAGTGAVPTVDQALSLAYPPVWSDHNQTVTIRLKHYRWSDGTPVTSRDVGFFLNLERVNKAQDSWYSPGSLPDDVRSASYPSASEVVLHLTKPFSQQWFDGNQLTWIFPLPQHAWDKTSLTGRVGNYDETTAGAKSVFTFLFDQSKEVSTYASSPLWHVVDGPWRLTGYDATTFQTTLEPNKAYSGPVRPRLSKIVIESFPSDTAEVDALRAGQLSYGYLPFSDYGMRGYLRASGFAIAPWAPAYVQWAELGYTSKTYGPLVRQLYIRQALESLVDQPLLIKQILQGMGVQNWSPIPTEPANPYSNVRQNPNAYNPAKAVSLLKQHGWQVAPGGTTTCQSPGTGATQCGPGIAAGTKLAFSLIVNSGNQPVNLEMQALQSAFSQKAGIALNVRPVPFTQVISTAFASCTARQPGSCPWQMADWGGGENLLPYPTGEQIFGSTGASNASHYASGTADHLVQATHVGGRQALAAYNSYLASQVPVIWVPNLTYQLSMISNGLKGANAQNPYTAITPESWHW
jgi:peptide/nickel transport system substrate-binding protein